MGEVLEAERNAQDDQGKKTQSAVSMLNPRLCNFSSSNKRNGGEGLLWRKRSDKKIGRVQDPGEKRKTHGAGESYKGLGARSARE